MATGKKTEIKYWSIYELYLKGASVQELQSQFKCHRATIFRALKYCREYNKYELSTPEEIDLIIQAKRKRLQRMYDRLDFLEGGWTESSVTDKDGSVYRKQVKGKFSPGSEVALLREIRELENDIAEWQGLRDVKIKHEISGELEITWKDIIYATPDIDIERDAERDSEKILNEISE